MTGVPEPDWNAEPAAVIAALEGAAERLETPCADGTMVWHRWPGPAGSDDTPPLVLFHGGWGSWTHWFRVIPALTRHLPVIAADLPGMGDSAAPPPPHTADTLSAIVNAGLDELLPDPAEFHLAAFSFGGIMAALAAAHVGSRCRTCIFVGAAGFGDLHYIVDGIRVPDESLPDAEIDAIHHENLRLLMMADEANITPLPLHVHRRNISRGRVRSRRISITDRLITTLPAVKARIGGIWGADDSTGNGMAAIHKRRDIFRRHQPDAPFTVIAGAGHWVMYEAADDFAAALMEQIGDT